MEDKLPAEDVVQTPESLDLDQIISVLPSGFLDTDKPAETAEATETTGEAQPEAQPEQPETQPETPKPDENQQPASQPQEETPQKTMSINKAAFALALFGWDTVSDGAAGLAGCGACFRRLGLWMYKPKDNGEVRVYDALEVANEHMEYCPWISGQAQSGTAKPTEKPEALRSGWESLAQSLRVKHRRQVRSTVSMDTLRAGSETPSMDGPVVDDGVDEETKKATDREWWSKIRRMKQVLNVKSPRRKSIVPGG